MNEINQRVELFSETGKPMGYIKLSVYEGFASISDVETFMYGNDIPEKGYMIVKFFDMYYAILYKDTNNVIVTGKTLFWRKEDGYWTKEIIKNFKPHFKARKVQKTGLGNQKIIDDIHFLDEDILVYNTYKNGWRNVLGQYQYAPSFLDYLCRTFYVSEFEADDLEKLHQYFKKSEIQTMKTLLEEHEACRFNPFKGIVVKKEEKFPVKLAQ